MILPKPTFSELLARVREGEPEALRLLLVEYGDAIRREVRFTLLDARLRRFVGESDVYQSVVMRFFSGAIDGNFTIDSAEDLVRLLKGIARTRIAELIRFWHAQRRNISRNTELGESSQLADNLRSCGVVLETAELAEAAASLLAPADRQILAWRENGWSWQRIAEQLGAPSSDAVRKQHERALARIAAQLDRSGRISRS
jgi:DNA-directed RNA polymerase specialized sigma24 family protein